MRFTRSFTAPLLAALAAFAAGCVTTTISDNDTAYVYVAENGSITYRGNLYSRPADVADELLADGATPSTLVTLIPQGAIPPAHLRNISGDFGKKGLSHVVIRETRKVSASIQRRGAGVKAQAPASAPRMKRRPRGDGRRGDRMENPGGDGTAGFRLVEP